MNNELWSIIRANTIKTYPATQFPMRSRAAVGDPSAYYGIAWAFPKESVSKDISRFFGVDDADAQESPVILPESNSVELSADIARFFSVVDE